MARETARTGEARGAANASGSESPRPDRASGSGAGKGGRRPRATATSPTTAASTKDAATSPAAPGTAAKAIAAATETTANAASTKATSPATAASTKATATSPTTTGTKATSPAAAATETATTAAKATAAATETAAAAASSALVPVPVVPEPLPDPRRGDVDEWGRSEHLRSLLRAATEPVYRHWFRAEWENFDRIPRTGGALIVGNHAGAIPSDAGVMMHGIETELGRPVYTLADEFFKKIPLVNVYWQRLGGVQAHPDNAYRLLREQGQLVLTFPEGNKGPGKHFSERYQLRRFGRGGFVEIAMRAGVPIIPVAVVGAEESMPIVYKSPTMARLTGLPYFPITANMLVFGPILGAVAWFPAKFKLRVLEPITFDEPPDQPRYSRSRIMDSAEMIRQRIQDALYDMLRHRESVWRG